MKAIRKVASETSDIPKGIVVAGTGHRPGKLFAGKPFPYEHMHTVALAELIARALEPEKGHVRGVISGMALGFDQALALAAIQVGLPFAAAVPFEGQELRWPDKSQQIYRDLLSKAAKVIVVSEGGYSPAKMQVRNCWMVDKTDVLLAWFDGTPGGTANCIRYAERAGKTIVNLANYEDDEDDVLFCEFDSSLPCNHGDAPCDQCPVAPAPLRRGPLWVNETLLAINVNDDLS